VRKRIENFIRRPFVRNVATVASGTAVAQAITMAFAPIITRLYGPEVFGLQGLFISVVSLLSTVAALSYPTAIVLPKSDSDALSLAKLSVCIGIGMALATAVALIFIRDPLFRLLNAEAISAYAFLIPIAMFATVLSGVLAQWLIRKKAFALTARFAVISALIINSTKSGVGIIAPTALVLIVTSLAGTVLGTVLTYIGWRRSSQTQLKHNERDEWPATLIKLARRHIDFPLLRTPQNLINAFSQSLPILMLSTYFGASSAGHYTIAISMLGIPSNLIGGSVMSVFYPRINAALQNGEDARNLIIKTTFGMAVTGAIPFVLVIFAGQFLFEFVFGEAWRMAGVYAQWLSIWLFLQYINKPAVSAIPALGIQGGLLLYEVFSTSTKILALWIGFTVYKDAVIAVALFSIVGSVAYVWLILWVIYRSGQVNRYKKVEKNEFKKTG
jgi:O-antigen/teichoic acid export membrane protein